MPFAGEQAFGSREVLAGLDKCWTLNSQLRDKLDPVVSAEKPLSQISSHERLMRKGLETVLHGEKISEQGVKIPEFECDQLLSTVWPYASHFYLQD